MSPEDKSLLPHHVQQPLCTTRLPYRQGRKLTAVKVYTINDESVHLLIFGVPSLNLRQETKALFMKFGKLLQFNIATEYPNEQFTETYHALYDRIQSARLAKKMLDGKSFYGGFLHITYAPELETIDQLRKKLLQRKNDVSYRLKKNNAEEINTVVDKPVENEKNETEVDVYDIINNEVSTDERHLDKPKLDMSEINIIKSKNKRRKETNWEEMKGKLRKKIKDKEVEIVDCTSVERDIISNINEALNYKNFGGEVIREIPQKPLNRIIYNNSNKKDNKEAEIKTKDG